MVTTDACVRCAACVDFCGADARAVAGRTMSAGEILDAIERDTVFFDESGGGVTFTGGEPLAQPAPLEALLLACRERRIHTAIETCGAAPRDTLLRLCALADLILFDIKMTDPARHRTFTGASNHRILENLEALAHAHPNVVVRIPVIPGINDRPEDLRGLHRLLLHLPVRRVDLLPYHRTGSEKYSRLGREYRLPDTMPPTPGHLSRLAAQMEAAGVPVQIAG